jgi:hypothetical protein
MIMKKNWLILLLLLLISGSCYFTDLSTYEVDIISTYEPTVGVESNLREYDSISFIDSTLLEFNIHIDTGALYFADLYLGTVPIFRTDTINSELWLTPFEVANPGDYILTLLTYYKSYSGSLADVFDAEFMIYDTSWNLTIFIDSIQ